MIIKNFGIFKDGGTRKVVTDNSDYCFDYRIGSNTKGKLFLGYPKTDNSNLIDDDKLKDEIILALKDYKSSFYQESIDDLIKKL